MNDDTGKYNHRKIEAKWFKRWEEAGLYRATDPPAGGPKKYILVEFPYPSGERLHIGHAFSFIGTDVFARFHRMSGFNVLCPMGWDAFGLPAENYAIKTGVNPAITTAENIANSKAQAKRMALSFDWEREISTTDPNYYRWTQWIFIQLFKEGLAFKEERPINWCPSCKIGLANEEVLPAGRQGVAGKCERCGVEATRRNINQWIVKITKYADRLIKGLNNTAFIEKVKAAQINWIGRSEGAQIEFKVQSSKFKVDKKITVFTTRPDTLYGASFMVLAPEHWLVERILEGEIMEIGDIGEIREYTEKARKKSDLERTELSKEKTGVFSGLYAINPVTEKEIPIWISDFVLSTYGTGAIMAVPAHDERDFAFAKKFGLPIVPVIEGEQKDKGEQTENLPYCEARGALVNSGEWNGLKVPQEISKVVSWLEEKKIGKETVSYHLRDWIFSRQHYWGEPIPMIFCEHCSQKIKSEIRNPKSEINTKYKGQNIETAGWWPVPEDQLPVELPKVEKYQPTESGESPLAAIEDWVNTTCPVCGGPAKRETDTMPNWAGSDWYYLAYLLRGKLGAKSEERKAKSNKGNLFSENLDLLKYWLPVDVYIGGDEHNTLHLLYSRFIYQFLWDLGVVPKKYPEPYYKRISHGVILGPDGQRMSKSAGNVINPDEVVESFGADALRLYLMFMGPFEATMSWNQEALEGCCRFLKRVWVLALGKCEVRSEKCEKGVGSEKLVRKLNQTIKKVGEDIQAMKFNTAVAGMMEFVNEATSNKQLAISNDVIEKFLLILAPFAPFITEELWEKLGNKFSVHSAGWPEYDPGLIEEEVVTIAVQVNGKLRGTVELQSCKAAKQQSVEGEAKRDEKVKKYLEGAQIIKVIFVPGKLINFVTKT